MEHYRRSGNDKCIIPIFILMVLCIALHKIISILEEIRDREKKAKTQN